MNRLLVTQFLGELGPHKGPLGSHGPGALTPPPLLVSRAIMIVINNPNAGESSGFLNRWLRTGRCWWGLRPQATALFPLSWTLGGVQPTGLSRDTPACESHGAWDGGLGLPAADGDRCPDTAHEALR